MKARMTRKNFIKSGLKAGAGLGATAMLASLQNCSSGPIRNEPNQEYLKLPYTKEPGRATFGIYKTKSMRDICEEVIPKVTDMSWFSKGDSVFIKVACNSGNDHPAVTSPRAVTALVAFFKDRGAGKIYVGDQSGVEQVRLTAKGRVSSTREMMAKNGLLKAINESGAILHTFDDQGYERGYFKAPADFESHWNDSVYLPRILNEVDHVVYLPRLSSHALAGYTCGIKIGIGWLRDDSRLELHQQADSFFEKFTEINHFQPLRDKLRLVFTLGEQALLNIGPDVGKKYDLGGNLVLSSERLIDHDYIASKILLWLDGDDYALLDLIDIYPKRANFFNRRFVGKVWGEKSLKNYKTLEAYIQGGKMEFDLCLSHLGRLQSYRPRDVSIIRTGDNIPAGLLAYLRKSPLSV